MTRSMQIFGESLGDMINLTEAHTAEMETLKQDRPDLAETAEGHIKSLAVIRKELIQASINIATSDQAAADDLAKTFSEIDIREL